MKITPTRFLAGLALCLGAQETHFSAPTISAPDTYATKILLSPCAVFLVVAQTYGVLYGVIEAHRS